MFGLSFDFTKIAAFFGIKLPPRWVIFSGAALVAIIPLVLVFLALRLKWAGDIQTMFWVLLAYAVVVAAILVWALLELQAIANRFHLRLSAE